MRCPRLLLPLTATLVLGLASPAMAVDWNVDVTAEYAFEPGARKIDVGDTVIWNFLAGDHTTTAVRGQADDWNSGPATSVAGTSFPKTFNTPGRFQYICIPHASFMKGTITVGEDTETDTVDRFKETRRGNDVTISYKLNEPAAVTYKLKGRSGRTVKRPRREAGRYSFKVRNLKKGEYRGTLTAVDDFDKKATPKNSFVIR
jgi:plastocyanin